MRFRLAQEQNNMSPKRGGGRGGQGGGGGKEQRKMRGKRRKMSRRRGREVDFLLDVRTFKAEPSLNHGRSPVVTSNEGLTTRKWAQGSLCPLAADKTT